MSAAALTGVLAARQLASLIRANSLEMILESGYGFAASCLSVADALAALATCWRIGQDPDSIVVLSKGHAAPALYAITYGDAWRSAGSYAQLRSPLQGHPNRLLGRDVSATSGSLGLAVGFGLGRLLARQSLGESARLAVIAGDGEFQAGCALEAIAYAAGTARGVCLIIDANGRQSNGAVTDWPVTERILRAAAHRWGVFEAGEPAGLLAFLASVRSDAPLSVAVVRSAPDLGARELQLEDKPMSYLPDEAIVRAAITRLRAQAREGQQG
jgi:transketolase